MTISTRDNSRMSRNLTSTCFGLFGRYVLSGSVGMGLIGRGNRRPSLLSLVKKSYPASGVSQAFFTSDLWPFSRRIFQRSVLFFQCELAGAYFAEARCLAPGRDVSDHSGINCGPWSAAFGLPQTVGHHAFGDSPAAHRLTCLGQDLGLGVQAAGTFGPCAATFARVGLSLLWRVLYSPWWFSSPHVAFSSGTGHAGAWLSWLCSWF